MKRYDLFRGYEKTYINQEVKIFCNNLLDNKEYKGLFPRINKEIENYDGLANTYKRWKLYGYSYVSSRYVL